ncbi:hypothetical protein AKJ65_02655 [candidate division MSBL1 archaeon SCGC-AAA259E19]|uniref:Uncharacterized protein n=1 Tax=candidate division MSBL1 archaeon SCGC-AAA259E19 TaxID=1698264 RepID=A0A133ULT2_9EURY|nr:hypothetical protein AKJ65_02655 [candidate division MSBL1 archaeon SCGC-AAA259E19]
MIDKILIILTLIGSLSAISYSEPIDKLIYLTITAGGVVGLITLKGYLDVAAVVAVMLPLSTIIILIVMIRMRGSKA